VTERSMRKMRPVESIQPVRSLPVRYVAVVEVSPLPGAEERKVRTARRYGRLGLLITMGWMLLVPASITWSGWPGPGFTATL
jgi:two-component system, NarL family, sensor histidine kinase DesK